MAFVYSINKDTEAAYTTHATPNTDDPTIVLRQTARNCDLQAIYVLGRGTSLTAITGIGYRVRRWTTVGTGGTAIANVSPRRIGTVASTVVVDKASAITPGTVSGAVQVSFGCGAAGPGGWVARDEDSKITMEAGSADELNINSVAGVTAMSHQVSAEIAE
jgi:hypothetical protein